MKGFLHGIMSIFFDSGVFADKKEIFNPQDLTEHYLEEIQELYMDGIYASAHYTDVHDLIESYKYKSDRQHSEYFVDLLAKNVDLYNHIGEEPVVVMGVPMHWSRYMIRGFNHINPLVSGLSHKIGIPKDQYLRAHITRRQSKLSKKERIKNRKTAFSLIEGKTLPENIILIDDIISTGSTANMCAKILKSAGVKRVYGFFIASNQ